MADADAEDGGRGRVAWQKIHIDRDRPPCLPRSLSSLRLHLITILSHRRYCFLREIKVICAECVSSSRNSCRSPSDPPALRARAASSASTTLQTSAAALITDISHRRTGRQAGRLRSPTCRRGHGLSKGRSLFSRSRTRKEGRKGEQRAASNISTQSLMISTSSAAPSMMSLSLCCIHCSVVKGTRRKYHPD